MISISIFLYRLWDDLIHLRPLIIRCKTCKKFKLYMNTWKGYCDTCRTCSNCNEQCDSLGVCNCCGCDESVVDCKCKACKGE
jgi:hypothetical protein